MAKEAPAGDARSIVEDSQRSPRRSQPERIRLRFDARINKRTTFGDELLLRIVGQLHFGDSLSETSESVLRDARNSMATAVRPSNHPAFAKLL